MTVFTNKPSKFKQKNYDTALLWTTLSVWLNVD